MGGLENGLDQFVEHFIGYNFGFFEKIDKNNRFHHISELLTVRASVFKMDGYTFIDFIYCPLVLRKNGQATTYNYPR